MFHVAFNRKIVCTSKKKKQENKFWTLKKRRLKLL